MERRGFLGALAALALVKLPQPELAECARVERVVADLGAFVNQHYFYGSFEVSPKLLAMQQEWNELESLFLDATWPRARARTRASATPATSRSRSCAGSSG